MFRFLFATFCLFISTLGQADQKPSVKITLGEWPPFITESQQHRGFVTHLIHDVLSEAGYAPAFAFYPWTRAYKTAALGRANATAVWMHKAEREQDFYYSEPVLNEEFVFFHLKASNFEWSEIADLSQYKLGGILSSSYGKAFDDALKQGKINIDLAPNNQVAFLKLLAGRIDALPLEKSVGLASIREQFTPEQQALITFHPKRLLENHSFLLVSKALEDSPQIIEDFNQVLMKYRKDGRYQAYFDRFEAGEYDLEPSNE
ncbi:MULTISPECIES: substrate-binding periplasmic protein [unclassified Marinomonas]|uniref:substrate-binding periplasmic protein n=1 Tax=unclassified Marinomonas TaxID=196814 RepID=UPI0007AF6FF7|nr:MULTISPECIES: ABC transporter substrate-binding protein [unclassified Marinomonas]